MAKYRWPVHLDPKNPTMDKKLCIVVCPNGALITKEQNPNQPYTPKEVAEQAIEAYDEGAVMLHCHARDEVGYVVSEPEPYIETFEMVLKERPDMIMCPSISITPKKAGLGIYEVATVQPMVETMLKRGLRFIETTVITPCSYISPRPVRPGEESPSSTVTPEKLQSEAKFVQGKGIKPEFMGHNFEAIENVREYLIDTGILKKPYFISMGPGMHKPSARLALGNDPWGMIYLMNLKQLMPPDTVIGTSIGGRYWLTLTVLAIMLGVDFVRVGMEDSMWLYPHKDDLIKSCSQVTRKIANIAKELGREIAKPDEAREILGLKE